MSENYNPKFHHISGAIDDSGQGYVLFEPLNPDDKRFKRFALHLGAGKGLAAADHQAAEFNAGGSAIVMIGQMLEDDAIPGLHR